MLVGMPEAIRGVQFLRSADENSTGAAFCATNAHVEVHVLSSRALAAASFVLWAGCTSPADIGEACVDTADCMADLTCADNPSATDPLVCMEACDPRATWICEGGLACLALAGATDRGVCYLGGALAAGDSCLDRGLECEPGAVCITFDEGARAECRKACRVEASDCADGETCEVLMADRGAGFCEPAP